MENQVAESNIVANLIQQNQEQQEGFVSSIMGKLTNNKTYIYIGIAIILLAGVGYYLFIKNKKTKKVEEKPKEEHKEKEVANQYFVIDSEGNPVPISMDDLNQIRQQVAIRKQQIEMMKQQEKQRPQLAHPGDSSEKEDENVANQDLTRSELAALHNELEKIDE